MSHAETRCRHSRMRIHTICFNLPDADHANPCSPRSPNPYDYMDTHEQNACICSIQQNFRIEEPIPWLRDSPYHFLIFSARWVPRAITLQ